MARTTKTLTGLVLVVGGALLGMLAMTALPWYRGSFGGILDNGTSAARIRTSIEQIQSTVDAGGQSAKVASAISLGIAPEYFRWLAITLVLAAALAALLGVSYEGRAGRAVAAVAVTIAAAGLVATAFAVQYVHIDGAKLAAALGSSRPSTPPGYGDFVTHTSIGAWAIVLGFLAIGAGAVLLAGNRAALRELLSDDDPDDPAEPADAPTGSPTDSPTQTTAGPVRTDKSVEPDERPW